MDCNPQIFKYSFSELGITSNDIEVLLGFQSGFATEPFPQYIGEIFEVAKTLKNIKGTFILFDNITVNIENNTCAINEVVFNTEKVVTRQLRKATSAAIFVCTAGDELEVFAREQMKVGNIPEGYIADLTGSTIVEAAMDKIQVQLADQLKERGLNISNRYSPGYCGWKVNEQQKLFGLLPEGICDIKLGDSSLMQPIKSISGIIGIGATIKSSPYTCSICDMKHCIYSSKRKPGPV